MASSVIKKEAFSLIPVQSGQYGTYLRGGYVNIGDVILVDVVVTTKNNPSSGNAVLTGFPNGGTDNHAGLIGISIDPFTGGEYPFRIWGTGMYPNIPTPNQTFHIFGIYSN